MLEQTAKTQESVMPGADETNQQGATAAGLKMSLWETRKLNEHHQSLLKEQLWQQSHLETQIYREQKKQFL